MICRLIIENQHNQINKCSDNLSVTIRGGPPGMVTESIRGGMQAFIQQQLFLACCFRIHL